jgi:hypothetical protein
MECKTAKLTIMIYTDRSPTDCLFNISGASIDPSEDSGYTMEEIVRTANCIHISHLIIEADYLVSLRSWSSASRSCLLKRYWRSYGIWKY